LSLPIQSDAAESAGPEPLRVESWLVIDSLDGRGRRPLRPDAVFAAHLLDGPKAEPPIAGQRLTGERGTAAWEFADVAENGGPDASSSYAYGTLEVAAEDAGVYLGRLSGAWQFYVNGQPHVGDAYRYGFGGVPVELVAGTNHIFVTGARGKFGLRFAPVESEVVIEGQDLTLPDIVEGESAPIAIGFAVHRTSADRLEGARIEVESEKFTGGRTLEPIHGLETRVVSLDLHPRSAATLRERRPDPAKVVLDVVRLLDRSGAELARLELDLNPIPAARGRALRTFRSSIDGSTQKYGEVSPSEVEEGELPGLVLSLHGASVKARNQIGAYGNYPGLWIVAPTNRRPFGFDWQDWGRKDAYEVRDTFVGRHAVSESRRYLTGHSMGGHGTWHLAANDPDQWAVVAPSAGWRSFDTYGSRPAGSLREWWHRADAASHTEAAIANLRQLPTFILHGDADKTVPASEAEAMLELLQANEAVDVRSHFEPGAGHWWDGNPEPGAACVQWPDMFAMFEEYGPFSAYGLPDLGARSSPTYADPMRSLEFEFRTVDPAVDSQHFWLRIVESRRIASPSRVSAKYSPPSGLGSHLKLETENVARIRLPRSLSLNHGVTIDGQGIRMAEIDKVTGEAYDIAFLGGEWRVVDALADSSRRRPERSGPFKRAFDREFILV
ncbi:MAG: prolyl oligopeptidase family serine peptidase, partial [Planctomycetota bacterium]